MGGIAALHAERPDVQTEAVLLARRVQLACGAALDALAPPLIADRANNGYREDWKSFMVTGINLPTLGCWEITGHYEGQDLTFVVWVAK